jgi:hypothetical protein
VLAALTAPARAAAQSVDPRVDISKAVWHDWIFLGLGPASVNREGAVAVDAGFWTTHDRLAFSLRGVYASRFFEVGDAHDVSALIGFRPPLGPHVDLVAGVGGGVSGGHTPYSEVISARPVLSFDVQLNLNYQIVGIALDTFAATGRSHRYAGFGLALALGDFR